MSDAQVSGSEPHGPYLQIERRIKDLIVYANIMVKQFPKHEKYQMAARIMGLCYDLLELAITTGKKLHKKTTLVGYRHFLGSKLIRKRSLYNIRRNVAGRPTLPRVMAYLSHAKDTASLPTVAGLVKKAAPNWVPEINRWAVNHGNA